MAIRHPWLGRRRLRRIEADLIVAVSGALTNYVEIREQVTLDAGGNGYGGTFTIDVYDTKGNELDHLAGTLVGTRFRVDSALPAAAAGN